MVFDREVEKNCFTPRDYQVELLDKACKRNVIVQLGTGAGKTFIAVLLLKEYGIQLNTKFSEGGKRAFFIVNSVSLVEQQAAHIECHTTLRTGRIHGNLNNDFWQSRETYEKYLEEFHVIVMTAQIFLDTIHHGYFHMNRAAVLIFDECHHAMGEKHAYRLIMENYIHNTAEESRPRVLGLTASLINDKTAPNALEAKLTKLENHLHCVIETASDLVAMSKYGANPNENIIICSDYKTTDPDCSALVKFLASIQEFCTKTNEFDPTLDVDPRRPILEAVNRTKTILETLGLWAAWKVAQVWEKELKKLAKQQHLPGKSMEFLVMGLTAMTTVKRRLESKAKAIRDYESFCAQLPHRVVRLLQLLSVYSPEHQAKHNVDEPLCGIIFVEQRFVSYILMVILRFVVKLDPSRFGFLKADYIIGFSGSSFTSDESQSLHKRQDEVLRKFRKGELNLIVSTSVLEEGVDVRHCNLVVKLDRPKDYRSYVQSKGRARKSGACYVMFTVKSDELNFNNDLRDFIQIEKLLIKRYKTVHNPSDYEFSPQYIIDDLHPPYCVKKTGAKVTLSTAIQLINRYCSKLPSDIFTRLVPQNTIIPVIVNGITKYKAELLLPINSPLKEPIRLETPMDNKKLAQMCVALKGCEMLHKRKELNDHLLPVGRESIALLSQLDEDPDEFCPGINAKVGSSRRKQLYDRQNAKQLQDAMPKSGEDLHVYVFEMELMKGPTMEHNPKDRKFGRPEEYEHCFGFLSSVLLPKIPPFPVYLRQGDMRVHVKLASSSVKLNTQSITHIKFFHHYIFDKVLQLFKGHLEFKMGEHTPVNTLIVPLKRVTKDDSLDYEINTKYVEDVVLDTAVMPRRPDEEDRKNYKFRAEDYRDAVVMPWYRNTDHPVFYYVADILDDLSPNSNFPDTEYSSFNDYFIRKYNLTIYDQEQSLLDVDFTSNRLNLLLPRPGGAKKKARNEQSQQQIFVPELMDCHPISATLWNLIAALPSCFYRLNHLLLADQLRSKIASEALDANPSVPEEFEWEPLSYPATYEEKQSLVVSKIQQLRELNKSKQLNQESHADDLAQAGDFDIGVWDPILGSVSASNPKVKEHELDETVGLMSSDVAAGDLSDEEDLEDMVNVMFDFSKYLKEKAKASLPDLGVPRADINPVGWGDPDEAVEDTPFKILGGSQMINMSGLMADLEKEIILPDVPANIPKQPGNKKKTLSPGSKKELKLKSMSQYDDREKTREEEIIDLAAFEDVPEAASASSSIDLVTSTMDSDDEAEDLAKGEERKAKDDAKFGEGKHIPEGAIYAEKIEETFSFSSPSPSSTNIIKKCPSESKGNDLMHLNPYGVSPSHLLAALTTSNAADGINLERLETIGDSFLKYAVTDYLYHTHADQHEGKLSFARSKEVSNCNLYRLGKRLGIPSLIVATKFEVQDSWLPPCSVAPDYKAPNSDDAEEKDRFMESCLDGHAAVDQVLKPATGWDDADGNTQNRTVADGVETIEFAKPTAQSTLAEEIPPLPHNPLTQQYISDKSIADTIEALIGAHLLVLGPKPTLKPPLLRYVDTSDDPHRSTHELSRMYQQFQFEGLEKIIGYSFNDKAFLIQAFTHASYYKNRVTGCYQRLEFLGDAVLDYMITRFLFEDGRQYSPGVLTDLRSALVNNTIFASLAVKYEFQKYFVAMCPGLHHMMEKFVRLCKENGANEANFNADLYMVTTEEEVDEGQEEDIEVPKALSDIFESVAGAIYLDSGRDLDVVWRIFHNLMKKTIDQCCANPPRSPIRELMELEPGKTRFSKMERIMETGKVRVTVDVGGKLRFTGMGRNYRIAKSTAAKRALKYLKSIEEQRLRDPEKSVKSSDAQPCN